MRLYKDLLHVRFTEDFISVPINQTKAERTILETYNRIFCPAWVDLNAVLVTNWEQCMKDNEMMFIASAKVIFMFLVGIIETHDSWAA